MTEPAALPSSFDVAVVGAGPAGLAAALQIARSGFTTALIAPPTRPDDVRTTALLGGSVPFLKQLGVYEAIEAAGAPLATMRLVDVTRRLVRAPEANFHAREIGLAAFGINIVNRDLTRILDEAIAAEPGITRIAEPVETVAPLADRIDLVTASGATVSARLAIAADGKGSRLRDAAGIDTTTWAHPQSALVLNLAHDVPHHDVSTEFHTPTGPYVLVPLPGNRSSVVLIETPEEAERLRALPDADLGLELERRAHSLLGRMTVEPGRQVWPLSSLIAKCYGRARIALIGETAHTFPPIGAQGLNLTLRDVASLAEIVTEARGRHDDIGGAATLAKYERARRLDVETRTRGVDLANRALLSDLLPVQVARAFGFFLAERIGPLRRLIMREGLTPSLAAPRLMRGLDLPRG
ncbi:UbiH/UbiF family hydroxylase [Pinisolibacter aquiterrae]|uniref:UbiH/UbiF family hydroxylase n=1 Tax=Pinisolibacter aquiterrae TaxID=2815579 RepID=UPI001C3DC005|nr:UbiH/UbiF family hydroxylase [Pinisolibacter aquiterrae]MBV5265936.1 UbiH/UbiF family hydroxylase [Pinisolibacter aquiterrae]MCC8237206.1 UbiH/UbiF family hydroxylase [Pinisolibacter aquiterrae]